MGLEKGNSFQIRYLLFPQVSDLYIPQVVVVTIVRISSSLLLVKLSFRLAFFSSHRLDSGGFLFPFIAATANSTSWSFLSLSRRDLLQF